MNRVVIQHYPVENLPEDLRKVAPDANSVTVTIEEDRPASVPLAELRKQLAEIRANIPPGGGVTNEEAVARIRALRDEWDD